MIRLSFGRVPAVAAVAMIVLFGLSGHTLADDAAVSTLLGGSAEEGFQGIPVTTDTWSTWNNIPVLTGTATLLLLVAPYSANSQAVSSVLDLPGRQR
jgi:hypothetical protein